MRNPCKFNPPSLILISQLITHITLPYYLYVFTQIENIHLKISITNSISAAKRAPYTHTRANVAKRYLFSLLINNSYWTLASKLSGNCSPVKCYKRSLWTHSRKHQKEWENKIKQSQIRAKKIQINEKKNRNKRKKIEIRAKKIQTRARNTNLINTTQRTKPIELRRECNAA